MIEATIKLNLDLGLILSIVGVALSIAALYSRHKNKNRKARVIVEIPPEDPPA